MTPTHQQIQSQIKALKGTITMLEGLLTNEPKPKKASKKELNEIWNKAVLKIKK